MINENDFLYSQTDGIIVSACPVLLEENPATENLWGYYLCIENNSKKKIHLVGKDWNITDDRGNRYNDDMSLNKLMLEHKLSKDLYNLLVDVLEAKNGSSNF